MVSGYCERCKRKIGGWLAANPLWQCPTCRKIWCESCATRKVGLLLKKRVCPDCHIEMHEGGIRR